VIPGLSSTGTVTAIDGEQISDNTIDDDSIDFGTGTDQVSLVDLIDINSVTKTAGRIFIADGSNFNSQAMSGDCTITSTGVISCPGAGATELVDLADVNSSTEGFGRVLISNAAGGHFNSVSVGLSVIGTQNLILGVGAGAVNTGGSNVFLGDAAGDVNTGSNNVYIGDDAGGAATGDSDNVFIGHHAGLSSDGTIRSVIIGSLAGDAVTTGDNHVLIGYLAGSALDTGINNVLIGHRAGDALTSGGANVFIGNDAGGGSNDGNLVIIGYQAGFVANGTTRTTIVGYQAGFDLTTGDDNTFIGAASGANVTTAANNTYLGSNSGDVNVTGINNVYIGDDAGGASTADSNNVFIGSNSGLLNDGGTQNVFVGSLSGDAVTTADDNTFLGYNSGSLTDTGGTNTFIGSAAGRDNTSGTGNVYLGYNAGLTATVSDELYITNSSDTTPLIHGDFSTDIITINGDITVTGKLDAINSRTTTAGRLFVADGSHFNSVALSGDCTITSAGVITCPSAGSSQLSDLADVNSSTKGDGKILISNASHFNSLTMGGDATIATDGTVSLATNSVTTNELTDINSVTKTAGRIFIADGSNFNSQAITGFTISSTGTVTAIDGEQIAPAPTPNFKTCVPFTSNPTETLLKCPPAAFDIRTRPAPCVDELTSAKPVSCVAPLPEQFITPVEVMVQSPLTA